MYDLMRLRSCLDPQNTNGLVSWWKAEANSDDAVCRNHAQRRGDLHLVTSTTGKVGQAFSFGCISTSTIRQQQPVKPRRVSAPSYGMAPGITWRGRITARLHVDGSQIGSGTAYAPGIDYGTPNDNFYVGGNGLGLGWYSGDLDEVAVWSRALLATEVCQRALKLSCSQARAAQGQVHSHHKRQVPFTAVTMRRIVCS